MVYNQIFGVKLEYGIHNTPKQVDVVSFPVSLKCGDVSNHNNTYMIMADTRTPPANPCIYKICPMHKNICRIRFDFFVSMADSCHAAKILLSIDFGRQMSEAGGILTASVISS